MKIKWYTPKEKMPPYDTPVMLNLKFPYVGSMHAYGQFTEKGWETIAHTKSYIVDNKYQFFCYLILYLFHISLLFPYLKIYL